ncbi:D-alanine--D-alanine ligase [Vibrio quintilis]|uniref:D-alanine--D-alanine ligase n=1 Tax=Vibrio quintilis TaxID=1117707 RepID=UPI0021C93BBF|nr:D-alanine--D-alanine ligase [Vibrio quintilis]
MPHLSTDHRREISPFEFFPGWFFYTPVLLQSLWQALQYKDFRLPLIANPTIRLSGMVGESKHEILSLAGTEAQRWIEPYIVLNRTAATVEEQVSTATARMAEANLTFPVVAKPDLGCRGAGVKLINHIDQLHNYIREFPPGARFLLQQKAPYQAEAGIFYVRYPGEPRGNILSITLKYSPSVTGDGIHCLKTLIETHPRAGQLSHLYLSRHKKRLHEVLPAGETFRLAFAGSHSRGAIFRDGNQYITRALTRKMDEILADVDGYYYGRLDIKFRDIRQLMAGKDFSILELNGASSEAAHIWDRNTPLREIFSTLLKQYRILFEIGARQKQRGHQPPSLRSLIRAWQTERQLTRSYPSTD